ncbi:hypothetical protein B566_EDAN009442 [Ephemera danica]|nr:hypothetical protein B566_EDAN009442 [Ephemera danica]
MNNSRESRTYAKQIAQRVKLTREKERERQEKEKQEREEAKLKMHSKIMSRKRERSMPSREAITFSQEQARLQRERRERLEKLQARQMAKSLEEVELEKNEIKARVQREKQEKLRKCEANREKREMGRQRSVDRQALQRIKEFKVKNNSEERQSRSRNRASLANNRSASVSEFTKFSMEQARLHKARQKKLEKEALEKTKREIELARQKAELEEQKALLERTAKLLSMAEAGGGRDFLSQYKGITNKLKKRFLRKPNVTEASEKYSALATQLDQDEQPDYAGYCCLSVAKCEQNLGSLPGETAALAAVGCYGKAVSLHIEMRQSNMAAALCLELGETLRRLKHTMEAHSQFQRAAQLQVSSPLDQIHALELVAACKIELGDYDGALGVYNDIAILTDYGGKSPVGIFRDISHRCEITRVLLLLILQPTPQKLTPELASLLEKYVWTEVNPQPANFLSEDLFLLLQSVVMACQTHDTESLSHLETDLWPLLSSDQRDLMRILVKVMIQSK